MNVEETTGTPENLEPSGTPEYGTTQMAEEISGGPERSETETQQERSYRLNIAGREVELSESEIQQRAQEALGLKISQEQSNRRIRELEAELARRDLSLDERMPRPDRQQQYAGLDAQTIESLDVNDPRDRALAGLLESQQRLEQQLNRTAYANHLKDQASKLRQAYGEEFTEDEENACIARVRRERDRGLTIDMNYAFLARRNDRLNEIRAHDQRRAAEANERERRQSARMVPTGAMGATQSARAERTYTKEEMVAMPLSQLKALQEKGYGYTRDGGLARQR